MYELSQSDGTTPLGAFVIAKKANIPKNYLNQLMIKLKKAGLVQSIRGKNGGFLLAKKPEEISIGEIMLALEDALVVSESAGAGKVLELFFMDMNEKIKELFDISLADLKKYKDIYLNSYNYTI